MPKYKDTGIGSIPVEWDIKTIDDIKADCKKSIISGPFGSNISSKYFVNEGVPVIRGNNLSLSLGTKFKDDDFVYITADKAKELNTWAEKGDLIFTAAGTIGQVGLLTGSEKYSKYIISNKQLRVTLNDEIIDPLFAYYWFASSTMIDRIIQRDTGSTIPLINLSVLKSLPVPIPPIAEQHEIALTLGSLDDKINLLHRQNKTLEVLAETLFRQWFVEETEGCETKTLEELINFEPREKVSSNIEYSFFDMKCLSESSMSVAEGIKRMTNSGSSFRNGDTLLAKITPCLENGKTGFVMHLEDGEVARGSTEFIVMRAKPGVSPYFVYCLARSIDFRNTAILSMTGTSGRQRVLVGVLRSYEINYSEKVMNQFHNTCKPQFEKIKQNQIQIRTLTRLRDTLLPKLMSGEVRIRG